ncbi:MAG: flagellar hook capping FlgD N-terminal domain-containing protein [Sphingomonadales bacterium]
MEILPSGLNLNGTDAATSSTRLADDFDTFLKLLTTQLQQQDPLDPLDSNQFTEQLVQFTSVEQQIQQNKNLESLVSLFAAQQNNSAVSFLGKEVMVESPTAFSDGSGAKWLYEMNATAVDAKIKVSTPNGTKVFETAAVNEPGLHEFEWDGKDSFGNELPAGPYVLSIEAETASGNEIANSVFQREIVKEIERADGQQNLVIGGLLFPPSAVVSVRDPIEAP